MTMLYHLGPRRIRAVPSVLWKITYISFLRWFHSQYIAMLSRDLIVLIPSDKLSENTDFAITVSHYALLGTPFRD